MLPAASREFSKTPPRGISSLAGGGGLGFPPASCCFNASGNAANEIANEGWGGALSPPSPPSSIAPCHFDSVPPFNVLSQTVAGPPLSRRSDRGNIGVPRVQSLAFFLALCGDCLKYESGRQRQRGALEEELGPPRKTIGGGRGGGGGAVLHGLLLGGWVLP